MSKTSLADNGGELKGDFLHSDRSIHRKMLIATREYLLSVSDLDSIFATVTCV